jgi:hypothetical protein
MKAKRPWTAQRRAAIRARSVVHLPSGACRLFQFPGSNYWWALDEYPLKIDGRRPLALPHNDNAQ